MRASTSLGFIVAIGLVVLAGCSPSPDDQRSVETNPEASATTKSAAYDSAKQIRDELNKNGIVCGDAREKTENNRTTITCGGGTLIVNADSQPQVDSFATSYVDRNKTVLKGNSWFIVSDHNPQRLKSFQNVLGGQIMVNDEK